MCVCALACARVCVRVHARVCVRIYTYSLSVCLWQDYHDCPGGTELDGYTRTRHVVVKYG